MIITFNGITSTSLGVVVTRVRRDILPATRDRLLPITGRMGAYDFGFDNEPLYINVRLEILASSATDRRATARNVAAWLGVNEVATLVFSDEPTLRYYARPVGRVSKELIANDGICEMTFFVPAGYAESTTTSTASPNSGTLETPVEITATIIEATASSLKIAVNGGYVLVTTPLVATDEIVIDTNLHKTTLNGEDARQYVSFGSKYFKLPVGAFTLDVDPATTTTAIVYRQRYK